MNNRLNCGIAGLSSPDIGARIKDNGAIATELNVLFGVIERLNGVVGELSPVIYQYPETQVEDTEKDICGLASQIRSARKEIERISNYLSNHQL